MIINQRKLPEVKLMIDLVREGNSNINSKEIQEKVWNIFRIKLSLQDIHQTLGIGEDEDYELENRKVIWRY